MKKKYFIGIPIMGLFLLFSGNFNQACAQANPDCRIAITSPGVNGESVYEEGAVNGTASIPNDYYLWILVHRVLPYREQGLWWPQGNSEISSDHKWSGWVTYGTSRDVGHEFEIAVVIVDRMEHLRLRAWISQGNWDNPIVMPRSVCPPSIRIIRRVARQFN